VNKETKDTEASVSTKSKDEQADCTPNSKAKRDIVIKRPNEKQKKKRLAVNVLAATY